MSMLFTLDLRPTLPCYYALMDRFCALVHEIPQSHYGPMLFMIRRYGFHYPKSVRNAEREKKKRRAAFSCALVNEIPQSHYGPMLFMIRR
jgi:hypothetical protein